MLKKFLIASLLLVPHYFLNGQILIEEEAICGILPGGCVRYPEGKVVDHADLRTYVFNGNALQGIATAPMGAREFEVWRSHLAVGGCTPKHTHATEEIFIVLKGNGRAVIGEQEFFFEAPCTVICPAHVPHQLFNLGDEPTDSILVLGLDSKIVDGNGQEMQLPWRH